MKEFFKSVGASFLAVSIFGIIFTIIIVSLFGSLFSFDMPAVKMPSQAVLKLDMSSVILAEQTQEPVTSVMEIMDGEQVVIPIGIFGAVQAINVAATDPAIQCIYLKPDATTGGLAQIEELRKALLNFRKSGKAAVAYLENPSNAGYYLASACDKIYMTPHQGGMNTLNGMSSQMIFLKDALDKLGINAQLIRHGKYKSAGEMFVRNSASKENLEQNQAMINSVWNSWSEDIAESRNISKDELNRLINNLELCTPADFLKNGLVDELLTGEQMEKKLSLLSSKPESAKPEKIRLQDYMMCVSPVRNDKAKIAVIYADGEIIDGVKKREVASDRFAKLIADIRNNSSIKAVVLRVNSPGGSVLASEKIKAELDLLGERVPVVASFGNYAASGGYWISACCDKVFANETSLTGSIGVFSLIPDFKKTLNDKLHVNINTVNSNEHSDMYGMTRPLNDSEIQHLQTSVEDVYERFTSIVAEGRKMSVSKVDSIGQGRVWTGAEALEIGLVDEIGTLEDAIQFAAMSVSLTYNTNTIEVIECPRPLTSIELMMSAMGFDDPTSIVEMSPLKGIENAFRDWNATQSGKIYARIPYEYIIR